jgi:hypothetical protein
MKDEKTYTVKNGLATLTLNRNSNELKCQIPVDALPTINKLLYTRELPNFEEWLDKDQDFGWLFRLILFVQISSSFFANIPIISGETPEIPKNIEKRADAVESHVQKSVDQEDMTEHDMIVLSEMFQYLNRINNLYVFSYDDLMIESTWDNIEKLIKLSYDI